jgi:hypothetical protein
VGITLDEILIDASTSSIAISDGTDTLGINADGSINVAFAAGAEIKITDGTDDLAINADGSINSVVTATNLDIRDLTHVTDSIKVGDGTDFLLVNTDGSINTKSAPGASIKNSASAVTTTATQVLAAPLANRVSVIIQNEGTANVYVGFSAAVTAANGIKISKSANISLDVGVAATIFMIASSGSQDVRFLEIA